MVLEVVGGAFLSSFLSVLFDRMASLHDADFIRGQKLTSGLLKKLKIKLLSVNGVLKDAEEKQIKNPAVREWLDELQDALYAAEDLLDEIRTEALRRDSEGDESESSSKSQVWNFNSTWFDEFDKTLEPKIVEVLERLEFIVNEKNVLGLEDGVNNRRVQARLPATSLVEEDGVYGRDEDKERIIELLLSDDGNGNKMSLIPVVGMGGIGKTTLAQLVYNDVRVKQHFDLQAWVYVSEEFDVVRMTQTIYGSITSQACGITDFNLLQVKLKEALMGKKCLFVHDDVWNENYSHWDDLKRPFDSVAHGSKIIVTTRNEGVALMMGTVATFHLKEISDEDCGLLFRKHAFRNVISAVHPDIEEISSEIIKKCKGLPLAAKALGGLLRGKENYADWDEILKSEIWDLQDDNTILPALRLSYHHLPSYLKRCFAYCSIFPKDYKFGKLQLVLLWMAEGLLSPQRRKIMEEVGLEYFDDLISRSFFQHSGGNQSLFTMHDLINDLAKFVSGEFCVRLEDSDSLNTIARKTRHFSYARSSYLQRHLLGVLAKDEVHDFEALYEAKCLRTFLALRPPAEELFWFYMVPHDLLPTLHCLRVLSLSHCSNEELPDTIGNLKHLRYIDLSYSSVVKLPETICTLHNLQTLLLSNCYRLAQLPVKLGRLINLRHLDVRSTKLKEMPPHMDKLKDLRTLTDFVVDKQTASGIIELKKLQYLEGTLSISGLHNIVLAGDASEANMRDKFLAELALTWGADSEDSQKDREVLTNLQPHTHLKSLTITLYGGTRFPNWLGDQSFSNLVSLRLEDCKHCLSLPPLGQLSSLTVLHVSGLNGVEMIGPEFYGNGISAAIPFRSLSVLVFKDMLGWQEWSDLGSSKEGGAFPHLSLLSLKNCPKLTERLPYYLPSLTTLQITSCEQLMGSLPRTQAILETPSVAYNLLEKRIGGNNSSVASFHADSLVDALRVLKIEYCWKLSPPTHCYAFLETLTISSSSDSMKFIPLDYFPKLIHLKLFHCRNLESLTYSQDSVSPTMVSLLCLTIFSCPNFVSFPDGGLHAPNLLELHIFDCKKLRSLPEDTHTRLSSLRYVSVMCCPKLPSNLGVLPWIPKIDCKPHEMGSG